MSESEHPSDLGIYRRALTIGVLGVGAALVAALASASRRPRTPPLDHFGAPEIPALAAAPPKRTLEPLTPELRRKGFHECNPHDALGLGPYRPYRNLSMGRILIPQKGGHGADMGYDVLIHFHGHEPARKVLVQVARGMTFVGIDKGLGSGAYSNAFQNPDVFPNLRRSIERTLQAESGDPRAHIRHLALSAWSAGYGAVNEILKRGDEGIDAVVLLDGLHAGWKPGRPHKQVASSADAAFVQPTFDFARSAMRGEKIFIFTHSQIDPGEYPGTAVTAKLLLSFLGLDETPHDPGGDPFGLIGTTDVKGLHVWSYRGGNEAAHCSHLTYLAEAVQDLLEPAWHTPPMDRDVPPTPAPKLGGESAGEPALAPSPDGEEAETPLAEGADTVELLPRPGAPPAAPERPRPPEPAELLGLTPNLAPAPSPLPASTAAPAPSE